MTKEKGLFVFRYSDVSNALLEVRDKGAALIPGMLDESFRTRLLREVRRGPFKKVEEKIGPVEQRFESFGFSTEPIPLPYLDTLRILTERIVRREGGSFPILRGWSVKDVAVQKYASDGGITSHRDYECNNGVIVIYTVVGSCTIEILDGKRDGPVVQVYQPSAGDVMILRGTHLAWTYVDERPFHRVRNVVKHETRISIAFRNNVEPKAYRDSLLPEGF